MIRKLKSGEYRFYSRKPDPKTADAAISAHSKPARQPSSMSAKFNISSFTGFRYDTASSTCFRVIRATHNLSKYAFPKKLRPPRRAASRYELMRSVAI